MSNEHDYSIDDVIVTSQMKGHYSIKNLVKMIDIISKVSRSPAFDLLTQALENSLDALGGLDGEKRVEIYPTTLYDLPCLVIEDNGCGMNRKAAEGYRDITGSIKKWAGAAGFLGIGRFAYVVRAQSGVYIDTHDMDSNHSELIYTQVEKETEIEEITFRSEYPDYENWSYYEEWMQDNYKEEMDHGTRVLLWNIDADVLEQIESNGEQWIASQFGHMLDDIEVYFYDKRVQVRAPPFMWYKTITWDDLRVDGKGVEGKVFLCNNPQKTFGIAVRAANRTLKYEMFDLVGYEKLQPRIWGWIDVNNIITRDMITPAKDEILDSITKRELWKKMREFLRNIIGEWEERLEAKRIHKVKTALKAMENRIHKTLKELEQDVDIPIEDEPPHPELADKDDQPPIEQDGKFVCNCCGNLLDKKPDKTGIVDTLKFLRTKCPHCSNPYKAKAHKSARGKKYRLYICKNCRHHVLHIDRTRFGFNMDIVQPWKDDEELEFIWDSKLMINADHLNFNEANNSTKKITDGKRWPTILDKELDNTPLELHILNCAASGYALTELGKTAESQDVLLEISRFKTTYYSVRV